MEKVAKKILDDAERERERIIKEGKNEVTEIRKQTEEALDKLGKETEKEAKELLEKEKRRLVGMAKLSTRNELLRAKREIMDSLFNEALDSLIKREPAQYLEIVKKLLKDTGAKDGEIIVGAQENKVTKEFIEEANNELGTKFSLSEERSKTQGGFILRQGKIEIDCSFEAILNAMRERIELELGKLLF